MRRYSDPKYQTVGGGEAPEADEEGTNAQQLAAGGGRSSRNAREASASRTRLEKPTEKHKAKNTTQMRTGIPTAGGRTLPTLEAERAGTGGTSGKNGKHQGQRRKEKRREAKAKARYEATRSEAKEIQRKR